MAKKMTKSQLLNVLSEKTELSKKDVGMVLEEMVNLAYSEVKKNGEFTVPGIGKLVKKRRAARMGRNPATGLRTCLRREQIRERRPRGKCARA